MKLCQIALVEVSQSLQGVFRGGGGEGVFLDKGHPPPSTEELKYGTHRGISWSDMALVA
jgi:hypothetical protein